MPAILGHSTAWAAVLAGRDTEVVALLPSHTKHVAWFLRQRWASHGRGDFSCPSFCLRLSGSPPSHHLGPQGASSTPVFQFEVEPLVETLLWGLQASLRLPGPLLAWLEERPHDFTSSESVPAPRFLSQCIPDPQPVCLRALARLTQPALYSP